MEESLPPPLLGCLICHTENSLTLLPSRRILGFGTEFPLLTCSNCGAVAVLDWNQARTEEWRIRYRKVPHAFPYVYAHLRFARVGWLGADEALDVSTEVFIQRQRLQQVKHGDLAWLKPSRLSPPPPLMSADEIVYLALKPASYCETGGRALFFRSRSEVILDSGIFYVTNLKVHLLGQRRDRSHRLSEVQRVEYKEDQWFVHVGVGGRPHYYQGFGQVGGLDAELIVAVVEVLCSAETNEG